MGELILQYVINDSTDVNLDLLQKSVEDFKLQKGRNPVLIMNDETYKDLCDLKVIRYDGTKQRSFLLGCPVYPLHYCMAFLA